jgi:predicted kinase
MPTLYQFIGMIASGKTTKALEYVELHNAITVNDDAFVSALHAGRYVLYDKAMMPLYKKLETEAIITALLLGRDVIVDRPLLQRRTRHRFVDMARLYGASSTAIVFPFASPEEHAERRHRSDGRGHSLEYWIKVARHHLSQYEPVTCDEGFDQVIHLNGG